MLRSNFIGCQCILFLETSCSNSYLCNSWWINLPHLQTWSNYGPMETQLESSGVRFSEELSLETGKGKWNSEGGQCRVGSDHEAPVWSSFHPHSRKTNHEVKQNIKDQGQGKRSKSWQGKRLKNGLKIQNKISLKEEGKKKKEIRRVVIKEKSPVCLN